MNGWHVRCRCGLRVVNNADEASLYLGSEEKDIVIFPPAQVDAWATDVEEEDIDECHKNDLL